MAQLAEALDGGDGSAARRVLGRLARAGESRDTMLDLLAGRAAVGSWLAVELLAEVVDELGLARSAVRRFLVDEAAVDDVAWHPTSHDDAPVQVNGHTDAVGADATNQTLSEQRAQAVVDYFTDAGIDPSRLHAQGFGETQPVAPNTHQDGSGNPEGRAQNRRVEIVIEGVDLSQPS